MPAQSFSQQFKDSEGKTLLIVDVEAPEGALPAGTTMQVTWIEPSMLTKKEQKAVDKAIAKKTDGKVLEQQAVDITFLDEQGQKVEPAKKVTVTFTSDLVDTKDRALVVHIDDLMEHTIVILTRKASLKIGDKSVFEELVIRMILAEVGDKFSKRVDAPTFSASPESGELRFIIEVDRLMIKFRLCIEQQSVVALHLVDGIIDVLLLAESLSCPHHKGTNSETGVDPERAVGVAGLLRNTAVAEVTLGITELISIKILDITLQDIFSLIELAIFVEERSCVTTDTVAAFTENAACIIECAVDIGSDILFEISHQSFIFEVEGVSRNGGHSEDVGIVVGLGQLFLKLPGALYNICISHFYRPIHPPSTR
jgi:hypothetical protein